MLKIKDIEKLFAYSTEMKIDDDAKKEKNNRRFEGISRYLPEVMGKVYELNIGITDALQVVNEKYSLILNKEDIENSMYELKTFCTIISNKNIDTISKACVIKNFKFMEYKKLLKKCNYKWNYKYKNNDDDKIIIKSLSRLNNMKDTSTKFIDRKLDETEFLKEIETQIRFFNELYENYTDICPKNLYAFVSRFDLKTIKKKNITNV